MLETVFRDTWSDVLDAFTRRRGVRRVAARAAPPRRRDPARLVAARPRPRPRPRPRDRPQPAGADARSTSSAQAFEAIERIVARGQARGRVPRRPRRRASLAWIFYGAIEEILTGWVLGQLPDGDEEVARGRADGRRRRLRRDGWSGDRPARARLDPRARAPSGSRSRSRRRRRTCRRCWRSSRTRSTMIAAVLAAEGVFALTLPLVIGPWSDTFQTPMGRRRPFMLAALGPMGFCLAIVAFMPNIWTMTLIVLAFFFAYYVYEPPYRGLYPDVAPRAHVRPLAGRPARACAGSRSGSRSSAAASCSTSGTRRRSCSRRSRRPRPAARAILLVHEEPGEGSRVFRGVRSYVRTSWQRLHGRPGGAALPDRERGVGGDVRGDADLRRPLHHQGARPAALDLVGGARRPSRSAT